MNSAIYFQAFTKHHGKKPSMITNEREYRITKSALRGFEDSLEQLNIPDPNLLEAMCDAMEGEIEALRSQLAEYEAFRSGEIRSFTVEFEHSASV